MALSGTEWNGLRNSLWDWFDLRNLYFWKAGACGEMADSWYQEDLAYIHDVGYADYAQKSAPGILEILAQAPIQNGLVVELGCGSGLTALELVKAGYQVLGIDISEAMIAIARQRVRQRVPSAEFRVESLFRSEIPPCGAVVSVGECLNYLFDPVDHWQSLTQLFCRIYTALSVGGVFIFDLVEPGQVEAGKSIKSFTEGNGWIVLVEKEEDREKSILTRRIISLRNVGEFYRRSDEIHQQQLYPTATIIQQLRQTGFHVQVDDRYGQYDLPAAHAAFIAQRLS